MRVLILADSCNPDWPSLPAITYHHIVQIAELVDVVVATQVRNAKALRQKGMGKAKVVFINTETLAGPLFKLGMALRRNHMVDWPIHHFLNYLSYLYFEWHVARQFKQALQDRKFDVVHRITPEKSFLPSLMVKGCAAPFIIGPLSDSLPWPDVLRSIHTQDMNCLSRVCVRLMEWSKWLPIYRSTYKGCSGVLASLAHTMRTMPNYLHDKVVNFPEVGFDPQQFQPSSHEKSSVRTILFVGRLVSFKRPEILVQVFNQSPILRRHRLVLVGDGPEFESLQELVKLHHLENCVRLTGQVSSQQVGKLMQAADIFAFPSVHELTGNVVVEAMACGLACVVVNYGGPGHIIRDEFGVKIPLGDREHLIQGFKQALERLVLTPDRLRHMGTLASQHAFRHYTWAAKAKKTVEVYRWVLGERKNPPPNYWDDEREKLAV